MKKHTQHKFKYDAAKQELVCKKCLEEHSFKENLIGEEIRDALQFMGITEVFKNEKS